MSFLAREEGGGGGKENGGGGGEGCVGRASLCAQAGSLLIALLEQEEEGDAPEQTRGGDAVFSGRDFSSCPSPSSIGPRLRRRHRLVGTSLAVTPPSLRVFFFNQSFKQKGLFCFFQTLLIE